MLPTIERLRELLAYDPDTGRITRIASRRGVRSMENPGNRQPSGYRVICVDGRNYMQHRIAWAMTYGCWPTGQIDHINLDAGDNRIENLRLASASQNQMNVPKRRNNTSGHKGVMWNSNSRKWIARIGVRGEYIYLGLFADKLDAAKAYKLAAEKYHGEFARVA